jgi:hypothetical protein
VLFGMMLRGFFGMLSSVQVMPVRHMRMMGGLFMVSACVVLCRFFVMSRRVLVMLCGFSMMFCAFFTHKEAPEGYRD